jgi:hypothetical protein
MSQSHVNDEDSGESSCLVWVETTPEGGEVLTVSLSPRVLAELSHYADCNGLGGNGDNGPLDRLIALAYMLADDSSNARAVRVN